ncbi:putative FAD-binding monooxygenase [Seiridium unicorne]|uniref:FAD-binding monooxygenase n=1 Tax=Seiridium unicorne TaxID=138068 RepID=A0ABR2URV6_9PEZI
MTTQESYPGASTSSRRDYTDTAVVIVGAGIGGMCVAIDLIKRNNCRDFVILEKSSGVGGVWYDNTYPGCAVDVQSIVYSYSFAQNTEWTREMPLQKEVLAYLTRIAQEYRLYEHVRFASTVEEASWDDGLKKWRTSVKVATGSKEAEASSAYTIDSDFFVSAVGQLSQPKYPDIDGLDTFSGKTMHSSRWDWSYDMTDKKVALIGTGCSAVQILPEVARVAKKISVFQREPHWVVPRGDFPIPALTRTIYRYFPQLQRHWRRLAMDENEAGHASQAFHRHEENEKLKQMGLDMMHQQLPDRPDLWEKLTPKFALGCKRVVASDFYFPALNSPHVELETRPIHSIRDTAIRVAGADGQPEDAETDYDLIIFATGFKAQDFLHGLKVAGLNGQTLQRSWKDGARAYLGVSAEGMPNFGMVLGPNTGLLHNSFILMIEAQSRYINGLIKPVLETRAQGRSLSLTPRHEITEEYNVEIQQRLQAFAVTDEGCHSWYKIGSGRITNLWPGLVKEYQQRLERVDYGDYTADGSGQIVLRKKSSHNVGRVVEEAGALEKLSFGTLAALSTTAVVGGYLMRSLVQSGTLRIRW